MTRRPGVQQTEASLTFIEHAGFWKRFHACVIDCGLVFVTCLVIGVIVGSIVGPVVGLRMALPGGRATEAEASAVGLAALSAFTVWLAIPWLYWALMESSPWQATVGKMTVGIIVTDIEGKRISFGRATGRNWTKIVSASIFLIGFIMAAFSDKKQALHDILAACLVVVKNAR